MKLYLVRHGETAANAQKIHQSHKGLLSETGISQARKLAERFRHIPIDRVLASPFERTKHTAEIITDVLQKQIEYSSLLVEVKRPTVIEGKLYDEPDAIEIKRQIYEQFHNPEFHHSDEENFVDLRDRASILLHHITSFKEENILLVTHGEFIKVIIAVMMFGHDIDPKIALKFYLSLKMTNTGITVCNYVQDSWKLLTWNDQAHLGE